MLLVLGVRCLRELLVAGTRLVCHTFSQGLHGLGRVVVRLLHEGVEFGRAIAVGLGKPEFTLFLRPKERHRQANVHGRNGWRERGKGEGRVGVEHYRGVTKEMPLAPLLVQALLEDDG